MSLSSCDLPVARIARPDSPSTSTQASRPSGWLFPTLIITALYALPLVVALRPVGIPVIDPDIWWHLRVGQCVSEHHTVPTTDPFSRYGADMTWVAYSWLFEVLVYRLYEAFGLAGIVVYRVAMSLAVVAALHRLVRRHEPRFLVGIGLTMLAAFTLMPLYNERPWLFTILFTTLTLDIVLDLRTGRRTYSMWLLPIVYIFWANLHIQFVYGLGLLALACLTPWVDALGRQIRQTPCHSRQRGERRILLLTGMCLAATLINPYHVRLYRVVWEYATQSGAFRCVNELRAMEFRETPDWVVLLLGAAAVFALGRCRRMSSFEVLFLAGAGILAFHARRDIWLLVLASMTILMKRSEEAAEKRINESTISIWLFSSFRLRSFFGAASLLATLSGLLIWQHDLSETNLRRIAGRVFPVEAAAFIAERGYSGPLFNDFNWGGFLIWSLPHLPVVLDGRTNLHGDERTRRICNTWAAGPGWRDDPDLASAKIVLADAQSPLGCVLGLDGRFEMVYEDALARVYVRNKRQASTGHHGEVTIKP